MNGTNSPLDALTENEHQNSKISNFKNNIGDNGQSAKLMSTVTTTNNNNNDNNDNNAETGRDQWGGQMEFLLACLGNAVGLGNCWRFPYLCYKNGGGAFLFPYIICCLVIGLPLFLIELGIGQFSSMGPAHLYRNLSPVFKGVGMASVISSMIVAIYYNMIIAWTLFYFVESFMGQKWQRCDNFFNTINCTTISSNLTTPNIFTNSSVSSTEEFFNNYMVTKSSGIDEITTINWRLVLALFVSWIIVALALIKGIQSSGKVVYFTATFPYLILVVLFIRGITLDGALDGLRYYFTPNWTRVKEIDVWRDAAVQVFYSFGIGGGGMITYASYNRFNNPMIMHTLVVGLGDFLTSIFCGAVVFTMVGYMATALDKPIDTIVQSGSGLAFIVIPEGLSQMPFSIVWSLCFFAMLFFLGIDSQFAMVETGITFIFDTMREKKPHTKVNKPLVVSVAAIFWFICGLPLCTNAGVYILTLMDNFSAGIPCLIIGMLEIFIITYIYGIDTFLENIKQMTNWSPNILLRSHLVVMISAIAPVVISVILYQEVYELFQSESVMTYGSYRYPHWATWAGWGIVMLSIIAIPIGMVHQFCSTMFSFSSSKSFCNRCRNLVLPTDLWWKNCDNNTIKPFTNFKIDIPYLTTTDVDSTPSTITHMIAPDSNNHSQLTMANSHLSTFQSSDSVAGLARPTNYHTNNSFDVTEF